VVASADAPASEDSEYLEIEYPEMAYVDSLLEAFGSSGVREGYVAPPDSDGPIFLRLLDAQSGLQIGTLSSPEVTDMPWDLLWGPDGEHLVSASSDGLAARGDIGIWDSATGSLARTSNGSGQ
jgi:WD40 repeat protein